LKFICAGFVNVLKFDKVMYIMKKSNLFYPSLFHGAEARVGIYVFAAGAGSRGLIALEKLALSPPFYIKKALPRERLKFVMPKFAKI